MTTVATGTDILVVLLAHREGTLVHHTLRAVARSVEAAAEAGWAVRVLVVLDTPDDATRHHVAWAVSTDGLLPEHCDAGVLEVSVGDPALARNAGIAAAPARFAAVLDGDNLPSRDWLAEGARALADRDGPAVVHPEVIVTFGERSELWPQWPSDSDLFNLGNCYDRNYWDTVCMAHREVFEAHPYEATRGTGFGFEDWHWNTLTLAADVPHLGRRGAGTGGSRGCSAARSWWSTSFPFDHFWHHVSDRPVAPHVRERALHALAHTAHAVFEATQTAELYAHLLPEGAGAVVPYGVPFGEIDDYRERHDRQRLRSSLGFSDETLVLVCVATIEPRKAQANLAAAFAGSERLRARDVALVLVGAGPESPYAASIVAAVAAWGEQRIHVEPVQQDTYRWYHAADVLVSGSDVESLPRSMLEAMAFGRPVAATSVFGVPELVVEGDNGFLCRSRDVRAMREMMERVVDTPRRELAAMGARAGATVRRRHDPAIYVAHVHEALLGADRAGGAR